jgi:hypothetical protein
MVIFYGEELLAPRPTPKLEDHPLSAGELSASSINCQEYSENTDDRHFASKYFTQENLK